MKTPKSSEISNNSAQNLRISNFLEHNNPPQVKVAREITMPNQLRALSIVATHERIHNRAMEHQARVQSILCNHLRRTMHAFACTNDTNCAYPYCKLLKTTIAHMKTCKHLTHCPDNALCAQTRHLLMHVALCKTPTVCSLCSVIVFV
jgi:hypothetical protein